ncbi:hypothetical protein WJX73_009239 [Symbiochloris irregularis]|uniref:Uncharacterized protein n=1 Tax=Symbiochloris irregularis TaxID=706552 RepID=A0AAW1NN59_9CHLO
MQTLVTGRPARQPCQTHLPDCAPSARSARRGPQHTGQRSRQLAEKANDEERCATCGGTGKVDCLCTRWSDNDVGCGACAGSGKSTCRSCGGGGTRIPIVQSLYVHSSRGPLE